MIVSGLRKLFAVPLLLFGLSGDPPKVKADDPSPSTIKIFDLYGKPENKFLFSEQEYFNEQKDTFPQTFGNHWFNKKPTSGNLQYPNFTEITNEEFSENTILNNPLIPTVAGSLAVLALILLIATYSSKKNKPLTNKDIKNILEKAFPEEIQNKSNTRKNVFIPRNLTPFEQSNLNLVLKIISYARIWNDLIHDENISIHFRKSADITQSLSKDDPALAQLKEANYPAHPDWKYGDLKLESYTLIEGTNCYEEQNRTKYNVFITDYDDIINLTASVLRELNRISIHQNDPESNLTLAEAQTECLKTEGEDLQEIYNLLSKDPLNNSVSDLVVKKYDEELIQYNKWIRAYEKYLAEVNSRPLSPDLKHFLN